MLMIQTTDPGAAAAMPCRKYFIGRRHTGPIRETKHTGGRLIFATGLLTLGFRSIFEQVRCGTGYAEIRSKQRLKEQSRMGRQISITGNNRKRTYLIPP